VVLQTQELQEELNNVSRDKQKIAVKKVVAGMMVGKDVSPLFMSMLKCMQTTDLELKKLVYLYLLRAISIFRSDQRCTGILYTALSAYQETYCVEQQVPSRLVILDSFAQERGIVGAGT